VDEVEASMDSVFNTVSNLFTNEVKNVVSGRGTIKQSVGVCF